MKYRSIQRINPQNRQKSKWYASHVNEGKIVRRDAKFCVSTIILFILMQVFSLSAFAQTGTPDYTWYGNGSASTFNISTADQLAALANLVNGDDLTGSGQSAAFGFVNKTITLTADIDLSTDYGATYNSGKGWIPIGHNNYNNGQVYFKGTFDGGGHTVSGLYIGSGVTYDRTGLFGEVTGSNAAVKNLGIAGADITDGSNTGGVAGRISYGSSVSNCYVTGTVSGSGSCDNIGGVVGNVAGCTVQNCYATAAVTGGSGSCNNIGGVAGKLDDGWVQYCYATGAVSGTQYVGGVAGAAAYNSSNSRVQYCAALNPSVTATASDGGRVAGATFNTTTLIGNYAFGGMTVTIASAEQTITDGTATDINGEAKNFADLQTSAGFPSQLIASPWTYTAGYLPGLNGATVAMPAHLLPVFAGFGTSGSPFQISTEAELAQLAELVNAGNTDYNAAHYILTNDLDLSAYGAGWNSGKGWIPIGHEGSGSLYFKGVFDGGGHTVSGLYINSTDYTNTGLFGAVSGATAVVKNLGVVGANITGNSSVGGVAGDLSSGGTVQNCYATGAVSGAYDVGGVAGDLSSGGKVQNCYATGAVTGSSRVGGVAGWVSGTVQNCAALNPSVTATMDEAAGRVAGYNGGGALTGNYAFGGMTVMVNGSPKTPVGNAADDIDGLAKNFFNLQTSAGFPSQLTQTPWTYAEGYLPGLNGVPVDMPAYLLTFTGNGTADSPYEITTAAELAQLAELVNAGYTDYNAAHYILTNDLDLSAYGAGWNSGNGWIPIGHENDGSLYFKGVFDGGGHTVSGLYISSTAYDHTGLFGGVSGATAVVKNLGVVSANVTGGNYTGGVAGVVYQGTVENCYATGTVTGGSCIGGVAGGVSSSGKMQNCYATGTVSGTLSVGGVAGEVFFGTVENCYATGTVTGTDRVGGVAGYVLYGTVQNCAALNPSVAATQSGAGRVAGQNNGTLAGNYAFGGMTVTMGGAEQTITDGTAININGEAKSIIEINADGTLFGLFTNNGNLWTTENGKLPGLNGAAADMPLHLLPTFTGDVAGWVGGTVQNCYVTGEVSGDSYVGGVAGLVFAGTVQNCYATGAVSGAESVGGVAGWVYYGTVQNCAALNPSVAATTANAGRVAGANVGGDLTGKGVIFI